MKALELTSRNYLLPQNKPQPLGDKFNPQAAEEEGQTEEARSPTPRLLESQRVPLRQQPTQVLSGLHTHSGATGPAPGPGRSSLLASLPPFLSSFLL